MKHLCVNMKSIKYFLVAFVLLALCSCSKTDYQKAVPADATFVAMIDMQSIAEKGDFQHSETMKNLQGWMGLLVSGKEQQEQMQEYLNDPMEMGFDFTMPIFVFKKGDDLGLVMKVGDEGDIKDFLKCLHQQGLASVPTERQGMMSGTILDDVNYVYDSNTFLILGGGSSTKTKQLAMSLMNLKDGESFVDTEAYDKMTAESNTDLVFYANLAALPTDMSKQISAFLPKGVKNSDVELIECVTFGKGELVMTSKWWGKTEKTQQLFTELNANLHKIEGRYMDAVSEDVALWGCAGVKGDWLLGKLKENKDLKEALFMLERGIDIEQMIRAIDGDVALELPSEDFQSLMVRAQVKNTDFLADVDYWKENMKDYGLTMRNVAQNDYVLTADGKDVYWGVYKDNLYFSTHQPKAAHSSLLKSYEADIKNSQLFIYGNLQSINKGYNTLSLSFSHIGMGRNMSGWKSLILKSASADEAVLKIELKNKDENFLKQIF